MNVPEMNYDTAEDGKNGAKADVDGGWVCMSEELKNLPALRTHLREAVGATEAYLDAYVAEAIRLTQVAK